MQLLVEMMELDDEEASCFSFFLIMQCLPTWLCILLEADDHDNIRQLVVQAECLLTQHGQKQAGTVAALESSED
jgi:hypothetical protein